MALPDIYESFRRGQQQASQYNPAMQGYTHDNLQSQIMNMFGQYGVPLTEYDYGVYADPVQRLNRISQEILSGQRTMDDVARSLQDAQNRSDPYRVQAEQTAAAEFNPLWNQIQRGLQTLGMERDRDVQAATQFGQTGQQALQQVYQQLLDRVTQNNQAVQASWTGLQGSTDAAYGEADQALRTAQEAALAQSSAEARALGVDDAVVDPHAELRNAVSELLSFNATGRANANSAIASLQNAFSGINSQAQNDVDAQSAWEQSRFMLGQQQNLGDILNQFGQQQFELQGQLNDVTSQRGARIAQLTNELARQGRLDELAEELQRRTLALQESELDFQRQRFMGELGLGYSQLDVDRMLGLGDLANERSRLDLDRELGWAQVGIDQQRVDIARTEAERAAGGPGAFVGQNGVNAFLNQLPSLGPTLQRNEVELLFNNARLTAEAMAAQDGAYNGDAFSAFNSYVGQIDNPTMQAVLRELADIYWVGQ